MTFDELGLNARLVSRLDALGLTAPTPIQQKAIPHALQGRDILGIAQTGTGKTAAFGIPLVVALSKAQEKAAPKSARGLILAPTRELANQIVQSLQALTADLRITLVVGGKSINAQAQKLSRGTDILVATPGRLIDLMDRRAVELSGTRFLVLDEADQMLDIGFIHALRRIAPMLGKDRQTMMFSATMPKVMEELSRHYLDKPIRVEASPPGKVADKVTHSVHFVPKERKQDLLIELLNGHRNDRALVFSRTKHGAERLMNTLERAGFAATSIHGNKSQGQRDRAIAAFKRRIGARAGRDGCRGARARHSQTWGMSTTTICRTCRKTTCTGSVGPPVPESGRAIAFCARRRGRGTHGHREGAWRQRRCGGRSAMDCAERDEKAAAETTVAPAFGGTLAADGGLTRVRAEPAQRRDRAVPAADCDPEKQSQRGGAFSAGGYSMTNHDWFKPARRRERRMSGAIAVTATGMEKRILAQAVLTAATLIAILALPALAQDGTGPLPENAEARNYGGGWDCVPGYRVDGAACAAIELPENAYATGRSYGAGWECRRGYQGGRRYLVRGDPGARERIPAFIGLRLGMRPRLPAGSGDMCAHRRAAERTSDGRPVRVRVDLRARLHRVRRRMPPDRGSPERLPHECEIRRPMGLRARLRRDRWAV
jgi:ATP-dependent RNA helicase RhlE